MHKSPVRALATVLALAASFPAATHAQEAPAPAMPTPDQPLPPYPESRTDDVVDTLHGVAVADPYRWLEQDVRNSPEVADWVDREQAYTGAFLSQLPEREWFAKELGSLLDYERFGAPVKRGERLFYTYNPGLKDQSLLLVQPASRDTLDPAGEVLLDPNSWSEDGTKALSSWTISPGGTVLAYAVQSAGSDWSTMSFLDLSTGKTLQDRIEWTKFSPAQWIDDTQFAYTRYPEPAEGENFQAKAVNSKVYLHTLGQPQSADRIVYETPDSPELSHGVQVSDDGRWLFVTTSDDQGTGNALRIFNAADLAKPPVVVATTTDTSWIVVGSSGDTVVLKTDKDAPRYRLMALDLAGTDPIPTELVAQTKGTIENAAIAGSRIVIDYLEDVKSRLRLFTLAGAPAGEVKLPGIGAIDSLGVERSGQGAWYSFSSFNRPSEVYALDAESGESHSIMDRKLDFDPDRIKVEQVFYPSADGTKIPMFIVRRADSTGPAPTLLYAYGGFNISLTPSFSSSRLAWIEAGGSYALANIRGGGEYGSAWHEAAIGPKRENAFADFIGAGEWLKANGVTGPDQLAIQGGSNGGLLMGVVTNRRPDLFDAVNAQVGVMDMLRFTRWGYGQSWAVDYGDPADAEAFKWLLKYSPYHNIPETGDYPPILVTTADTDDRVIPGHSFKYAAALQAADLGPAPHLIRIEKDAGHGAGMPVSKVISSYADIMGFLAHYTGLKPQQDDE